MRSVYDESYICCGLTIFSTHDNSSNIKEHKCRLCALKEDDFYLMFKAAYLLYCLYETMELKTILTSNDAVKRQQTILNIYQVPDTVPFLPGLP